jgi:hypothetical protein
LEHALGAFLDDADDLGYVIFEGQGSFFLRFALLGTDANVLVGEAVGLSRLESPTIPGPDARLGLVALGWAAPAPPSRIDFATEWTLPVDLAELGKFIVSTARIYGIDPGLLRPRFGITPPATGQSELVPVSTVSTAPGSGPGPAVRRWWHSPATQGSGVVALLILLLGRDRLSAIYHSLPQAIVSGAFGILFLGSAGYLLNRATRTADPFSISVWDRWRGRDVTNYASHRWWGIFGTTCAVIGVYLMIAALTTSSR